MICPACKRRISKDDKFCGYCGSRVNFKEEEKTLDICIDFKKGSTFFYEDIAKEIKGDFKAYDTTNKKWRHLNFFQY